jgi:hypothetical protein
VEREALLGRLAATPARLASWVTAAGEPASGDPDGIWGPREVTRHLLAVERVVWQARLDELAAGDQPRWSYAEPGVGEPDDRPLDALVATFAARRAETIGRLRSLDGAGWARTGVHQRFGVLDVARLCRVAADHDDEHLGD